MVQRLVQRILDDHFIKVTEVKVALTSYAGSKQTSLFFNPSAAQSLFT